MAHESPDSDIGPASGWTTAPLWSKIDEVVADDSDFITGTASFGLITVDFGMTDAVDPATNVGHVIRIRARNSVGATAILQVGLYSGVDLITLYTPSLGTSFADFSYTLSAAEADAITDYSDIRISLIYGDDASSGVVDISWIKFDLPLAAPRAAVGSAVGAVGLTSSAVGRKGALQSSVGVIGVSANAAGIKRALSSGVGTAGLGGAETGSKGALGTSSGRLGVAGQAQGAQATAAVQGSAQGSFGFSGSASGVSGAARVEESASGGSARYTHKRKRAKQDEKQLERHAGGAHGAIGLSGSASGLARRVVSVVIEAEHTPAEDDLSTEPQHVEVEAPVAEAVVDEPQNEPFYASGTARGALSISGQAHGVAKVSSPVPSLEVPPPAAPEREEAAQGVVAVGGAAGSLTMLGQARGVAQQPANDVDLNAEDEEMAIIIGILSATS